MNKIEKIFKKKIKGEALENLAKIFDVNLDKEFKAYEGWTATDMYAKLKTTPTKYHLELEAYFHSSEFHRAENKFDQNKYREGKSFTKTIGIPYNNLTGDKK